MTNPWFRLYAEFATDPKVQMMSEVMQRRFIMLLCARCNGNVTLQDEEVTFLLRISNEEWQETKRVFIAKNFIDEANNLLHWDKRQFRSDSSRERVSRHRENKKQECNVTVTPPEQNRTDTDKKKEDSLRSSSSARSKKISFDFDAGSFSKIPESERLLWQTAYPALSIDQEISKAAAWLMANPKNKKSNYERFLVNWFAKSQDRAPIVGRATGPPAQRQQYGVTTFDHREVLKEMGYGKSG